MSNDTPYKCPKCNFDLLWDDWEQEYCCLNCNKNYSKKIVEDKMEVENGN
jgi:DNA-directed RNA polymerase subunit RPC12/RpoP